MKIGLFADPHYSDKVIPSSTRYHSLSYKKIEEAMKCFKSQDVSLVVCLGDLTDDCVDIKNNPKELEKLAKMINSFGIDFYSLMGNHDYLSFTKEEFDSLTGGAYPPFEYETDGSVLVFLDCNFTDESKAYEKRNIDWTNTFLPLEQLNRLQEIIEKTEKDVYVFSHQNLDTEVDKYHIVRNANEIQKIIENNTVKMVIQGHYHQGHDTKINGIEYHTLPAMCERDKDFYEILEIK